MEYPRYDEYVLASKYFSNVGRNKFKVSKDIASWKTLTEDEKNTFKRALAGLTGLDTHQADDGMPLIMLHTTDLRKKQCIHLWQ